MFSDMFTSENYLSSQNKEELLKNGYTVVPGIIDGEMCDKYIEQYKIWISKFTANGTWPRTFNSLIPHYGIAHYEPSWNVRMKLRPVFAEIWGTDKLLTSLDSVAIGRPPEGGQEDFAANDDSTHWLHTDQESPRRSLHAFQGSLYLEDADEDDWTFEVMANSHKLHTKFFIEHPHARAESMNHGYYRLKGDQLDWFQNQDCPRRRVPVPKGGLLLWDARLIHANARPKKRRHNPGRFRYAVFVTMTPSIWAADSDINVVRTAYNELRMTRHWSSQGVSFLKKQLPCDYGLQRATQVLPEIARTEEARLLCGILPYDYSDGQPNGPTWQPKWV